MNWTNEEIDLLKVMSNEEVARITGRTVKAVKMQRYRMNGHYIPGAEDLDKVWRSPASLESKETRIAKIKMHAMRLGVRLLKGAEE